MTDVCITKLLMSNQPRALPVVLARVVITRGKTSQVTCVLVISYQLDDSMEHEPIQYWFRASLIDHLNTLLYGIAMWASTGFSVETTSQHLTFSCRPRRLLLRRDSGDNLAKTNWSRSSSSDTINSACPGRGNVASTHVSLKQF